MMRCGRFILINNIFQCIFYFLTLTDSLKVRILHCTASITLLNHKKALIITQDLRGLPFYY
ncbi:MAG: hypothetical protein C4518_08150 [Desulfobacteraceae bacterium]|nr:MAG: hypothetical protein C4518_08150 [Desulfobacteraceae bacterium]